MRRIARAILVAALAFLAVSTSSAVAQQQAEIRVTVQTDASGPTIDPNIYGQFVEHLGRGVYEGIWVGEGSTIPNVRGIRSDVVAALRRIHVPIVRWPGGCFAETYHWSDGIGPRSARAQGVNTAWGDEPETNAFGTDEFLDFVGQIGAKPFLAINVTSASPGEAQSWLAYLTAPATSGPGRLRAQNGHPDPYQIPFIGIGNETWGCGGNMTAEHYADVYRQYVAVLGTKSTLVTSDANSDDYAWTETLLRRALYRHDHEFQYGWLNRTPLINMMSVHFYSFAGDDWSNKSPATGFTESDWARAMQRADRIDEITRHSAIMDRYDPQRSIGISVDEWGTWWKAPENRVSNLYQVATLRDAVMAGLTLNIFQNHAERVRMANIAQMINVLQSMILTRGSEMIVTPTYHVFDMYQVHQGGALLPARVQGAAYVLAGVSLPAVSASASRGADGTIHISLVNIDPNHEAHLLLDMRGRNVVEATGQVLTADAMDAHPDFGTSDPLVPSAIGGIVVNGQSDRLVLPAKSVAVITIK